jgi:hypothetical protein
MVWRRRFDSVSGPLSVTLAALPRGAGPGFVGKLAGIAPPFHFARSGPQEDSGETENKAAMIPFFFRTSLFRFQHDVNRPRPAGHRQRSLGRIASIK